MDIGRVVKTIVIPLPQEAPQAIPLPEENPFKPAEKPVEAPNWPIKAPVTTPAENT